MLFTVLALVWAPVCSGQAGGPAEVQQDQDTRPLVAADQGVLFVSERDGHRGIYLMAEPGGAARALTPNTARNDCPVCSPDASLIAYLSDAKSPGGLLRVWVMKADGAEARALTAGPTGPLGEWSPSWSPDGKWIVFVRQEPDPKAGEGVWAIEVGTGNEVAVIPADGRRLRSVKCSPGSETILFDRQDADGIWKQYLADGDGTHILSLVPGPDVRDAQWATNDTTIAYSHQEPVGLEVWIAPTKQPRRKLLLFPTAERTWAQLAWSVTSKHMAVALLPRGALYLVDTTSGQRSEPLPGARCALADEAPAGDPRPDGFAQRNLVWDSQGRTFLFAAERDGNWDIYRAGLDGQPPQDLTNSPAWDGNASWLRPAAAASARAVRLQVEQVDICDWPDITAYFSLLDDYGAHATGVPPSSCAVFENGREQKIVHAPDPKDTPGPMNIWLVLDHTGSMVGVMQEVKDIAKQFCDIVRPKDRIQLVAFANQAVEALPLTNDLDAVRQGIDSLQADGATPLFDAVGDTVTEAHGQCGRKAVVLLTDGGENSSTRWQDKALLFQTIQAAGAPIYAIGRRGEGLDEDLLRAFAKASQGQYFPVDGMADLRRVFRVIRERIETQFSVTYRTWDPVTQNRRRPLLVRLRTPFGSAADECVFNEVRLDSPGGPTPYTAPR